MRCRSGVSYVLAVVFVALAQRVGAVASPVFGPVFVYQRPIDAMVDITNDLGVAVLQDHVGTRSNFAFSPYGVASVLVLLYEGARGESARQIHDTLHFPWERDVTRIGFRDIHRHLRTYFSHEGYLSGITLSKNHTSLLPEYQRVLRFYGYDVSKPQGSATRRPEDKTTGPEVTTPDGILLVITNETSSSAEEEVTTQVTTLKETTTVEDGSETTTNADLMTASEVPEGTPGKEMTTDLPGVTEVTTEDGQELTTSEEVKETVTSVVDIKDRIMVTDADATTTMATEGEVDESTSTEAIEEVKETEMEVTETVQVDKVTTQAVDETTAKQDETTLKQDETTTVKIEVTTQDLKETTAKETEETAQETFATTQNVKEIKEEITETTKMPNEPSTLTETVATEMPIDEIEMIPDVEMPVDTMSENQLSTLIEEQTTTNPATETSEAITKTDSTSQETSESPSSSSSLSPSASPEETEKPLPEETTKPQEEFVSANALPATVTETSSETDKETTETESEDETSTVEETSTATDANAVDETSTATDATTVEETSTPLDATTVETTEAIETTTDATTLVEEERLTTTEGKVTTEENVTKNSSQIISMKTVMETKRDNSTTRKPRPRRRRALRDASGLEYPDMSLQLQNGMYGSSVARNVDVLQSRAPRAPFLVDGVLEEAVPVMKYTAVFPFAFVPRLHAHALEFPLDDERYKLLLILPVERRGLRQLIHDLGACPLREVFRALAPTRVHAVIPSFMVEGFVILTSTLQQMGIWDVFDPRRSNLSGMSGDPELFVRNIEQSITVVIRNYVEIVDIQTRTMAARSSPEVFLATHPFLYFVVDTETRVSLMAGKIVDPLNSRIY